MNFNVNHTVLMRTLDWAYEKALIGMPGMDSAQELALEFMKQEGSVIEQANSLIRWQNVKAASSGFLTGLGGIVTLPVAIPANLATVLFIQVRMIAAIAYMGGLNLKDEKVKTMVYICLAGNLAKDVIQEASIILGTKLTIKAVESISQKTLQIINQKVGFKLLSVYGSKGILNLGKAVPLAGGIIGGAIDTFATNLIGNTARKLFLTEIAAK
jgi:hypothetical protein